MTDVIDDQAASIVRTILSGEHSEDECVLMVALALRAAKDAGATIASPSPPEGKSE